MLRKTLTVLAALGLAIGLGTAALAQSVPGTAKPDSAKASTAAQSSDVKKAPEGPEAQ